MCHDDSSLDIGPLLNQEQNEREVKMVKFKNVLQLVMHMLH